MRIETRSKRQYLVISRLSKVCSSTHYFASPLTNTPFTRVDLRRNCRSDRRADRLLLALQIQTRCEATATIADSLRDAPESQKIEQEAQLLL